MNILDVIVDHSPKQIGPDTWKILCPFHDDHDPSLVVYTNSDTFYCFVCKTSGTAEYLHCKLNGIPWSEYKQEHKGELDLVKKTTNYKTQVNLLASQIFFERLRKEPCQDVFKDMKVFDEDMAVRETVMEEDMRFILDKLKNPVKESII